MAERLGVTRRTVGEWERTSKVPDSRLVDLRNLLGPTLDEAQGATRPPISEAAAPVTITIGSVTIAVWPAPGHTEEEVYGEAEEIFAAIMRTQAERRRQREE